MKLNKLPKIKKNNSKRIGRGAGSGHGKTSGRGTKGLKARGKISISHAHFEGGQRPLFKRLPYRKGKGNAKISNKPLIVNLKALNILPKNSLVDLANLIKFGIVNELDARKYNIKILGHGQLSNQLTVKIKTSKSAKTKIEKAGGKVEI